MSTRVYGHHYLGKGGKDGIVRVTKADGTIEFRYPARPSLPEAQIVREQGHMYMVKKTMRGAARG